MLKNESSEDEKEDENMVENTIEEEKSEAEEDHIETVSWKSSSISLIRLCCGALMLHIY